MRRAVIASGGTGGHFYPGYVLARALRERGWQTLFLLRREDPARALLEREELPYAEVAARGMPRRPTLSWAPFLKDAASGLRTARNILRAYRPACVVGMGGYVSFPAVLAAWWLRIPSLLHEANAQVGFSHQACLPFATRLALGLPLPRPPDRFFGIRFELTGTPVRPSLWNLPDPGSCRRALGLDPSTPTVLVLGGSQGARRINELLPQAMALASAERPGGAQCAHLSGPKEEEAVRAAYERAGVRATVRGFLEDMRQAYAAADLVVCRSGASTLAELIATRKPALLIPFPAATGRHQEANAMLLHGLGAARRLREPELSARALAAEIGDLLFSHGPAARLAEMSARYSRLDLPAPDASVAALVRTVEEIAA